MDVAVLAHQGGWDEALLVAGPVLLFAGIVWNAKRRAVKQAQTSATPMSEMPTDWDDADE